MKLNCEDTAAMSRDEIILPTKTDTETSITVTRKIFKKKGQN